MKKLNNLKQIRLSMNLSMADVAKLCGIHPTTIMRVENFEQIPSQYVIIKISRGLKMDATKIFNLDWRTFDL